MIFSNCPQIYQNLPSLFNLWTDKIIHVNLCKKLHNQSQKFLRYLTCKIHLPKIFQIVKKIFAMFFKQLGTIGYKNLCQRVKRETFQSLKFWKIIRKMIMCLVRRKTCLFLRAIHTAKFGIQNYWEWLDHLPWKKDFKN